MMSVYQVEEYYVSVIVPDNRVQYVKEALDNCEECACAEVNWDGNNVIVELFDSEMSAESVLDVINATLKQPD